MVYCLADPHVRKGGSGTCEQIVWALTQVAHAGHQLEACCVLVQLDNSSGENKNNTVLRLMAWLQARGAIRVGSIGFLATGHTHEDIDMEHGSLARYLANHAQTVHSFN
eukprot:10735663-Lingulodinium_polyedra.AAC.1